MKSYKIGFALFAAVVAACGSAAAAEQAVVPVAAVSPTAIAPTGAAAGVEAAITTLERDWAAAIVKKDTAALGRLLADDFNGTSPTAHTFTKTVAIDDLKSGRYVVASMVLDEISVNVYGDVAVAFTSQKESSKYGEHRHQRALSLYGRLGEKGRPMAGRCLSRLAVQRRSLVIVTVGCWCQRVSQGPPHGGPA